MMPDLLKISNISEGISTWNAAWNRKSLLWWFRSCCCPSTVRHARSMADVLRIIVSRRWLKLAQALMYIIRRKKRRCHRDLAVEIINARSVDNPTSSQVQWNATRKKISCYASKYNLVLLRQHRSYAKAKGNRQDNWLLDIGVVGIPKYICEELREVYKA